MDQEIDRREDLSSGTECQISRSEHVMELTRRGPTDDGGVAVEYLHGPQDYRGSLRRIKERLARYIEREENETRQSSSNLYINPILENLMNYTPLPIGMGSETITWTPPQEQRESRSEPTRQSSSSVWMMTE
jgi:hypothetical protein